MSRGLGALQREVKETLDRAFDLGLVPLPLAHLRAVFVINTGGRPERGDTLSETRERSLRRALKALVDRGDVIAHGAGGPGSPRRYVTVEKMASFFCDEVKNTAHAKQVFAKQTQTPRSPGRDSARAATNERRDHPRRDAAAWDPDARGGVPTMRPTRTPLIARLIAEHGRDGYGDLRRIIAQDCTRMQDPIELRRKPFLVRWLNCSVSRRL
jgi:hypothetical protein